MAKKIYKYATGEAVPEGAEYLYTREEVVPEFGNQSYTLVTLVWHYFLVEVEDENS